MLSALAARPLRNGQPRQCCWQVSQGIVGGRTLAEDLHVRDLLLDTACCCIALNLLHKPKKAPRDLAFLLSA